MFRDCILDTDYFHLDVMKCTFADNLFFLILAI